MTYKAECGCVYEKKKEYPVKYCPTHMLMKWTAEYESRRPNYYY